MKKLVLLAAVVCFAAPAFGQRYASPAFTAVTNQGRPLTGAVVSAMDTNGDPITLYTAATGTGTFNTVPSTGVVQFFNDPGIYNVTVSGSGITRTFNATIPVTSGGITDADLGGVNGVGWVRKVSPGVYVDHKVNLTATTDPDENDDGANGYSVGSEWINTTSDSVFFCADSQTGAAVWVTNTSNIASINSQTGPAITIATGSTGTDVNTTTTTNLVTINVPSASSTNRGVVSTGSQQIKGVKTFLNTINGNDGMLIGTDNYFNAFFINSVTDIIGFFDSSATTGWVNIDGPTGSKASLSVTNSDAGNSIVGTVSSNATYGVTGTSAGSNAGAGILGISTSGDAAAGIFTRSTAAGTQPVVTINRANSSDTQSLLEFADTTSSTAATYVWDYKLNSVIKGALQTNGQFIAASSTTPTFSFLGDTDTGVSNAADNTACLIGGGVAAVCGSSSGIATTGGIVATNSTGIGVSVINFGTGDDIQVNTTEFRVNSGELKFTGTSGDGTGKVLCVKSDGFIGTCTDAPNGSGVCTCS